MIYIVLYFNNPTWTCRRKMFVIFDISYRVKIKVELLLLLLSLLLKIYLIILMSEPIELNRNIECIRYTAYTTVCVYWKH